MLRVHVFVCTHWQNIILASSVPLSVANVPRRSLMFSSVNACVGLLLWPIESK